MLTNTLISVKIINIQWSPLLVSLYIMMIITIEAASSDSRGVGGNDPMADDMLMTAPRPLSNMEGNIIWVICNNMNESINDWICIATNVIQTAHW
jgi:hypothetical protein